MDRHDIYRILSEELPDHELVPADDGWLVEDRTTGDRYALHNIAAIANQLPESERQEGVRAWIRRLTAYTVADLTPDQARYRLRLRLAHENVLADPDVFRDVVHRTVTEGLLGMVMIGNELGAETVTQERLDSWQLTASDALEIALHNTLADEATEEVVLGKDDLELYWVRSSFWASTALLGLADRIQRTGYGAIAMVPTRDSLLWFEPKDRRVVETTKELMGIGGQWFVDGPGPVSPDVYWVRPGGEIERITRIEGRHYEPAWTPGGAFSRMLTALDQL